MVHIGKARLLQSDNGIPFIMLGIYYLSTTGCLNFIAKYRGDHVKTDKETTRNLFERLIITNRVH